MTGTFRLGGDDKGRWPTIGAALNVAARRAETAEREIQIGVYEGERQLWRVVREQDGTVLIQAVAKAPAGRSHDE